MRAPFIIAVLLDVVSCLGGLVLVFWGAMVGVAGLSPDGPVHGVSPRIHGVAVLLLGLLYVFPVATLVRTRKALVGLGAAALIFASVATAFLFEGTRWPLDSTDRVGLIALPLLLSGLPLLRTALAGWRLRNEEADRSMLRTRGATTVPLPGAD